MGSHCRGGWEWVSSLSWTIPPFWTASEKRERVLNRGCCSSDGVSFLNSAPPSTTEWCSELCWSLSRMDCLCVGQVSLLQWFFLCDQNIRRALQGLGERMSWHLHNAWCVRSTRSLSFPHSMFWAICCPSDQKHPPSCLLPWTSDSSLEPPKVPSLLPHISEPTPVTTYSTTYGLGNLINSKLECIWPLTLGQAFPNFVSEMMSPKQQAVWREKLCPIYHLVYSFSDSFRLLQEIEWSFLCYTVGSCWLSSLHIVVSIC